MMSIRKELAMKRINFTLVAVIVVCILFSCSPKSYCFFSTKERAIYIADEKKDSIKIVYINSITPSFNIKEEINLNPSLKFFKFSADSIMNQDVYISITTDNQNRYSLRLTKEDWSKDTVFKCRYLIK